MAMGVASKEAEPKVVGMTTRNFNDSIRRGRLFLTDKNVRRILNFVKYALLGGASGNEVHSFSNLIAPTRPILVPINWSTMTTVGVGYCPLSALVPF